jgi:hypothetical protein
MNGGRCLQDARRGNGRGIGDRPVDLRPKSPHHHGVALADHAAGAGAALAMLLGQLQQGRSALVVHPKRADVH